MLIQLLSNKYPGMRLWLTQRLTALMMAIYVVALVMLLVFKQPSNYLEWLGFMQPWWMRSTTLIFFISLFVHAWLGVQDVLKDYIANLALRRVLHHLVNFSLWLYLAWICVILWKF